MMTRLSSDGHLYVRTASNDLGSGVRNHFEAAGLFLSALMAALKLKGTSIDDYEAVLRVLQNEKRCVSAGKRREGVEVQSNASPVNEQIVKQLWPDLEGTSLLVAKAAMANFWKAQQLANAKNGKRVCYLLLVCEEIMGAANVTVKLYTLPKEAKAVLENQDCRRATGSDFSTPLEVDSFLLMPAGEFADSGQGKNQEKAYSQLVESLARSI